MHAAGEPSRGVKYLPVTSRRSNDRAGRREARRCSSNRAAQKPNYLQRISRAPPPAFTRCSRATARQARFSSRGMAAIALVLFLALDGRGIREADGVGGCSVLED